MTGLRQPLADRFGARPLAHVRGLAIEQRAGVVQQRLRQWRCVVGQRVDHGKTQIDALSVVAAAIELQLQLLAVDFEHPVLQRCHRRPVDDVVLEGARHRQRAAAQARYQRRHRQGHIGKVERAQTPPARGAINVIEQLRFDEIGAEHRFRLQRRTGLRHQRMQFVAEHQRVQDRRFVRWPGVPAARLLEAVDRQADPHRQLGVQARPIDLLVAVQPPGQRGGQRIVRVDVRRLRRVVLLEAVEDLAVRAGTVTSLDAGA